MTPEITANPEQEKPQFLYHASQNRQIEEFEPRRVSVRDPSEGPVVFATPDKACATAFLVGCPDKYVSFGRFNTNGADGPWHYVCNSKEWFDAGDKGGAIYRLPGTSFENDPAKGLGEMEWTSKVSVRPVDKEEYESGLEAMLDNGVHVYFVDDETFDAIKKSNDHGSKIIEGLEPYRKVEA